MGCCRCCCIAVITIAVILAISSGLFAGLFPYPNHASCKVDWEFGHTCDIVKDKLVQQINEWTDADCNIRQHCGYELLSSVNEIITGLRITPIMSFTDKFNFTFKYQSYGCSVKGYSRSEAKYAVLDFGYNYCNLKNLIHATHLYKDDPEYSELSADGVCTMYSMAYCSLYDE